MTLECGRQEKCEPCDRIDGDYESQKDVCITVARVAMRPDASTLDEDSIARLTHNVMAQVMDDDDYIAPEIRDAAVESTKELIQERRCWFNSRN